MQAKGTILAAVAALVLATGCNDSNHDHVVAVDYPPHTVDGVYSVTGDHLVTIYWRANQENDIDYYKVYRNSAPTGTFTLIGTSKGTSFADTNVVNGDTYYYAVSAVDFAGQESPELSYENVYDTPRPEGFGVALSSDNVTDSTSGWDFSAYRRRASLDPATDIYYHADVPGGHYLVFASTGTEIQDAGYVPLIDVSYAPPAGWSADGVVEAIVGHSYIVLTRDTHYAKFSVVSRDGNGLVMNWAYQIAPDNPELVKRLP